MHLLKENPWRLVKGDYVRAGVTIIGYAGNSGYVCGSAPNYGKHLHYAVQDWDSKWNNSTTSSIKAKWMTASVIIRFDDLNCFSPKCNPAGNPKWPNLLTSGNCPGSGTMVTINLGNKPSMRNRSVQLELIQGTHAGAYSRPVAYLTRSTDSTGSSTTSISIASRPASTCFA